MTKISSLLAFVTSCVVLGACSKAKLGLGGTAAPSDSAPAESFAPNVQPKRGEADLYLPGASTPQHVVYADYDGTAVMEGDMVLGPVKDLPLRYGKPRVVAPSTPGTQDWLWPNNVIPYDIIGVSKKTAEVISKSFAYFQCSKITFRPRTTNDKDYVRFVSGNGCASYVGRIGGPQEVTAADECSVGNIAHELMHAAGFNHEQSRSDRDSYVTIDFAQILPGKDFNFAKVAPRGELTGAYDYASIMHYPSHAFSKSDRATITPKRMGVTLGNRDKLSELDCAALATLYGKGATPILATKPTQPTQPGTEAEGGSLTGWYKAKKIMYAAKMANGSRRIPGVEEREADCKDSGNTVTCEVKGQKPDGSPVYSYNVQTLSCVKDSSGLELNCNYNSIGSNNQIHSPGKIVLRRSSTSSRNFSGATGDWVTNKDLGGWEWQWTWLRGPASRRLERLK